MAPTLTHGKSARNAQDLGRFAGLLAAGVALLVVASSCESGEYSLEPTFCDDWCRATLISSCDEDPEDCVENCELTKASDACFGLQTELLHCYEAADRFAFACAGMGFQSEIRVRPDVCGRERDELFECVSPGISQCLSLCRVAQRQQLETVTLGSTGLVDFGLLRVDAGAMASCPALDRPCEELCWSVFGLQSEGLADLGVVPGAEDLGATVDCLQASLLGCFGGGVTDAGAPAFGLDAGVNAGPPGERIAETIARCGGAIALD